MRVLRSGRAPTSAHPATPPRSGATSLLLLFALLVAFGLGFLAPQVDLRFADYQRLATARERALQLGVAIPAVEDSVTASVSFDATAGSVPAEVRLPGGPAAAFAGEAWSLEVRVAGESAWLRLMNLQPFPVLVVGLDAGGAARRALDPAWVVMEDRDLLLQTEDGALVLRAARGPGSQTVRVRLPREAATGGELAILCRLWNVPGPEARAPVLESLPVFEAAP